LSINEKDYSDTIRQLSSITGLLSLFCGFTFTGITILLTRLPNPNEFSSQVTLFFLAVLFNFFLLLIGWGIVLGNYYIKNVPPRTRGLIIYYSLLFLGLGLWGIALALIFFLWNLTYLAWASAFVSMLFLAVTIVFIYKPYWEWRKAQFRSSQT